jgi:hypothetical protein
MSKGDTSRSWPGDTNLDAKSNSLSARKRHLMWERVVSVTVFRGFRPVPFAFKKSVVLMKLLISFVFTEVERNEFAAYFRGKVEADKIPIPTSFPFGKEETFGKDCVLPRLCVPLSAGKCRKLRSYFFHVQTGKVSDLFASKAEAQGVICAGIYSILYTSFIWFKNIVYLSLVSCGLTPAHSTRIPFSFPPGLQRRGWRRRMVVWSWH